MTIGEALAQARREAGLSVVDVSRRTRIRETIINGIERDDFSACRGDFYARGHIRAIAHVIGVDPEPLVGEYDAAYLPPETIPGARQPQATFEEDPPLAPVAEDQAAEPVTPVDPHVAVTWREQVSGSEPFSLWRPVTRNDPPIPDEPATFRQDVPPRLPPGPDQTVSPFRADPPQGPTGDRPRQPPPPQPPQVRSEIPPGPVTPRTPPYPVSPETPAPYGQDRSHYAQDRSHYQQDPSHYQQDPSRYGQRPIPNGRRRGPGTEGAPGVRDAMGTPSGPASHRRRGVNWSLVLGVALVVVLGLGGYLLLTSGGNSRQAASAAASHQAASRPRPTPSARHATPTPTPTHSAPPIQPLKPASIAAFGPAGAGQGDNPQLAQSALDGNAASGWHSDWYTTPQFGNLQPGTGLLLDMGHTVTLAGAQLAIGDVTGADIELRAGSSPVLSNLAPVAHVSDAGGTVNLHLTGPSQGRYVLVWFTKLPQDQAGTFQASVSSIKLQGSG